MTGGFPAFYDIRTANCTYPAAAEFRNQDTSSFDSWLVPAIFIK